MNKVIISAIFCALLSGAVPAVASQTLSVGYAQSKVEDFKNMPGVNLQYRYEWDSPVSVVASFTTLENSEDSNSSFSAPYVRSRKRKILFFTGGAGISSESTGQCLCAGRLFPCRDEPPVSRL